MAGRFEKGRQKTGGRKAGTPNVRTVALRGRLEALVDALDPETLVEDIRAEKDLRLRWDVLRWGLEKLYGKPTQPVQHDSPLVDSPEWLSLRAKLLDALEPFPEAADAVSAALEAAKDDELRAPIVVELKIPRASEE